METGVSLSEEEGRIVAAELDKLHREVSARFTALLDRNGQILHLLGDAHGLDTTSLATLIAGSIAATGGLAKLLGEDEFSILFHEGERDNLHITLAAQRFILVVLFDRTSPIGLVRLRAKQCVEALTPALERTTARAAQERATAGSPLAEVTEEDIDRLFR
ncbi:MAG: roadblock/LC7 domain-containing protein [Nitrospirae bacterium]|nr:roadblock/LC7 domain-containing protein [Nitrospirota bacterium]